MKFKAKTPLVTLITPSYNHSRYVLDSLESIRKQTYKNIEHIIIDDCSTDNSVKVITEWIQENNYDCVFIQHKKNSGISATLNEGIQMANGIYWTTMASDDIARPERVEIFVRYLQENPNVLMAASNNTIIDCNTKLDELFVDINDSPIHYESIYFATDNQDYGTYKALLQGNHVVGSFMVRRDVFNTVGLFDENLTVEDWDMWLRISKVSRIHHINRSLTYYRIHQENSLSRVKTQEGLFRFYLKHSDAFIKYGLTEELSVGLTNLISALYRQDKFLEIARLCVGNKSNLFIPIMIKLFFRAVESRVNKILKLLSFNK